MEVEIGHDNLKFETGPFHYFGQNAIRLRPEQITRLNEFCQHTCRNRHMAFELKTIKYNKPVTKNLGKRSLNNKFMDMPNDLQRIIETSEYVSDYSLRVVETLLYVKINRSAYIAAHNLSYLQQKFQDNQMITFFEKELDRQIEIASTPLVP